MFEKIEHGMSFPFTSSKRRMLTDELESRHTFTTCWKQISSKHRITSEILVKASDLIKDINVNITEDSPLDKQGLESMNDIDELALLHIKLQLRQMAAVNINRIQQSECIVEKLRSIVALPTLSVSIRLISRIWYIWTTTTI